MHYMRWLWRAKRWAQNPPSTRQVVLILSLVAGLCALAAVERWVGWPDWATLDPASPRTLRP
ncbi:hypothetical protein [Histidinibacterium aquaticum]|uniref:Uncharacterized protein n=1 Tax=Histidinibacterium aquaticum TaxID=2613962 RepID=A0A5J5GMI5_9RHOB|nr:hypothetical protein [Histidinibacterium aquaticum]KAA9008893.1 hypothetical protein F3S47_06420 [Histidinibacterium aquaticum]